LHRLTHSETQPASGFSRPEENLHKLKGIQFLIPILYDQFIVLAADENFNEASGCSIDSSVWVIRQVDEQFSLGLFDRTLVAFLKGDTVELVPLVGLAATLTGGYWNQNSLVFNNVIATKGELKNGWVVPAAQTWLKRYLTKTVV
jgi:hypothetical protein